MAFALDSGARLSLLPPEGETSNDAAGFASCYGPHRCSPCYRAFDAGLRPRPFPGEAASLLPGLLAATRTGLTPASNDELTNTKEHHVLTSRCHLLLCWAHERSRLEEYLRRPRPGDSSQAPLNRLTQRETEVLRLLAKGKTNPEIASALFLGEATIKTHVARVLAKLQLRDRVQAVVWAYETGLIQPGE